MNLSLSKVKIHDDMSDETTCFSAAIHLDGKKVGEVRNEGIGGCNGYYWNNPTVGKQIEEWAKTQPTEFDFEKLDQIIDGMLSAHEEEKQLKRWCKTTTVFRLKGDEDGAWRRMKVLYNSEVKMFLKEKYGDRIERIANDVRCGWIDRKIEASTPATNGGWPVRRKG